MSNRTFVIGVGMTKFEKPGSREWDYPDMVKEAGTKALDDAGIAYDSADITMLPTTTVPLESEGDARKVLKLIDALEEHDDVQNVYSNFDIPDSVLQEVEASA